MVENRKRSQIVCVPISFEISSRENGDGKVDKSRNPQKQGGEPVNLENQSAKGFYGPQIQGEGVPGDEKFPACP